MPGSSQSYAPGMRSIAATAAAAALVLAPAASACRLRSPSRRRSRCSPSRGWPDDAAVHLPDAIRVARDLLFVRRDEAGRAGLGSVDEQLPDSVAPPRVLV